LDETLNVELILPPRKVISPNNADQRKQCRYHQNTGHSTEECQALKDKIEELIQAGHLRRFVRNGRDPPHPGGRGYLNAAEITKIIEATDNLRGTTPPGRREVTERLSTL